MFLSMYYYLTINHGKRPNDLRYWEYGWYTSIFLWPTVLTIAGIITDSFAPLGHIDACYLGGEYPPGCDIDPFAECIRGYDVEERENEYLSDVAVASYVLITIASFIFTYLVYLSYSKVIRKVRRYNFAGAVSSNRTSEALLKEVTQQAVLYSLAYFNGFFWILVLKVLAYVQERKLINNDENVETMNRPIFFIFNVLGRLLLPLQGLFNCIVYLMPSFRRWKQAYPDLPTWMIVWNIIFEWETPLLSESRRAVRTSIINANRTAEPTTMIEMETISEDDQEMNVTAAFLPQQAASNEDG